MPAIDDMVMDFHVVFLVILLDLYFAHIAIAWYIPFCATLPFNCDNKEIRWSCHTCI